MKSKKIIVILGLTISVALSSNLLAFAQDNEKKDVQNSTISSGIAEVGDSNTIVSDVLTFDEVVESIANDNNISISEASKQVIDNFNVDNSRKNLNTKLSQYDKSNLALKTMAARSATYRSISSTFTVTSSYKPSVRFYCETDEWAGSSFRAIKKIINVSMNRGYNGISKQFGGSVFARLEAPNKVYWLVDGDFYNNGTTSFNGAVSIGLGEGSSVSFGVSHSSNHYAYCYEEGYTYF